MGRGRAKAKQTKVARELKYNTPETDLDALQRELSGNGRKPATENQYGDYFDDVGEGDEAGETSRSRSR